MLLSRLYWSPRCWSCWKSWTPSEVHFPHLNMCLRNWSENSVTSVAFCHLYWGDSRQLECALGISNATTVSKSFKQSLDHFWGVAAATLAFTTFHLLEPRLMVIVAFIKLLERPSTCIGTDNIYASRKLWRLYILWLKSPNHHLSTVYVSLWCYCTDCQISLMRM